MKLVARCRKSFIALFVLVLAMGTASPASLAQASSPSPLTKVNDIRALTPEEAKKARPVRLHGVVTAVSGWKNSFFFQDETAGISVDAETATPGLTAGDRIELEGVTGPGRFAPVITASAVKVVGQQKLPQTRLFNLAELTLGNQDSQYVMVRGLVRSASVGEIWGRQTLHLRVDIGGGSVISVRVHDFPEKGYEDLLGATVTIRGVCGTIFNNRRQLIGIRLFAQNFSDIKVEKTAALKPFELPVESLDSLLQFNERKGAVNPHRIRGTVTYVRLKQGFYLQEGSQGIYVRSHHSVLLPVGTQVDVVGYPTAGQYSPELEDVVYRNIGTTQSIEPVAHTASEMIAKSDGFTIAPYDSILVRTTASLVEVMPHADDELLILKDGTMVFSARLPRSGSKQRHLEVGSYVQLTGICLPTADDAHEVQSVEILLRSPNDLVVLRGASWWTAKHAVWVVVILALSIVGLFVWVAVTRKQAMLRAMAMSDPLTGLYNRRGFLLLAEQQWQLALRGRMSLLLFYIDVDDFKLINDTFGHKQGDVALTTVSGILADCFRKSDILGRFGGDEFAVAAVDADPAARAILENRIHSAIGEVNKRAGQSFQLSLSVGVIVCDETWGETTIEELLGKADALMYEQKKNHHGQAMVIA